MVGACTSAQVCLALYLAQSAVSMSSYLNLTCTLHVDSTDIFSLVER